MLVTVVAAAVALAPALPGSERIFGSLTGAEARGVAAVAWLSFEIAAVTSHLVGPHHAATEATSAMDGLLRLGAILSLVWFSGSAASPVWVAAMIDAFVWDAKSRRHAQLDLAMLVGPYIVLACAFWAIGKAGDAGLTVLVLLASVAGHTLTARTAAESDRVRQERDSAAQRLREAMLRDDRERMARELHDGVGANVMALVLRLRRAAQGGEPAAVHRAERAADLLGELRGVVWSLRNEKGTLAELGKLIDAGCRSARGDRGYERVTPLADAKVRVGPQTALCALRSARELVRFSATRGGVTKMTLHLSFESAFEIVLEDDGPSQTADGLQGLREAVARACASTNVERRADGAICVSITCDGERPPASMSSFSVRIMSSAHGR